MSKKKISAHPKGPGVWMPKSTLDSPAWKALSDGSQRLYIALKAKADNASTILLTSRHAMPLRLLGAASAASER